MPAEKKTKKGDARSVVDDVLTSNELAVASAAVLLKAPFLAPDPSATGANTAAAKGAARGIGKFAAGLDLALTAKDVHTLYSNPEARQAAREQFDDTAQRGAAARVSRGVFSTADTVYGTMSAMSSARDTLERSKIEVANNEANTMLRKSGQFQQVGVAPGYPAAVWKATPPGQSGLSAKAAASKTAELRSRELERLRKSLLIPRRYAHPDDALNR
jgi:hypothetical protein